MVCPAHGVCLHMCAKIQVLSWTFFFVVIFSIDCRVKYESAVEGLSIPLLTAWSQAAFEPAALLFFLRQDCFPTAHQSEVASERVPCCPRPQPSVWISVMTSM